MKKKRLIPVVLIKNGWVVQSNNFNKYKNIGHPVPTIKRLSNFCSDEIIIIDSSNSLNNKYIRGIRKAHKVHHKNLNKENGTSFGMLIVNKEYFK